MTTMLILATQLLLWAAGGLVIKLTLGVFGG